MNDDGLITKLTIGLSNEHLALKYTININPKLIIALNELKINEIIGTGEFGSNYFYF